MSVPDLYALAYMPGTFRCPVCAFVLTKSSICLETGTIGTTEEQRDSEPCPNDGTMMMHVTYREQIAEYEKRFGEAMDEKMEAEIRLKRVTEYARYHSTEAHPMPDAESTCDVCAFATVVLEMAEGRDFDDEVPEDPE